MRVNPTHNGAAVPPVPAAYVFQADSGGLVESDQPLPPPMVMDSWLVIEGRVRRLDWHEHRFSTSVAAHHPVDPAEVETFLRAARRVVPATGSVFPRVECTATGTLQVRVRPAPELRTTIRLWTSITADPRAHPRIKGPDADTQHRLRDRASHHGAEEAVLLSADGHVLEGAYSSLVWWRGGTLCMPDPEWPILASVTRALVVDIARRTGTDVQMHAARPTDLTGLPVWSLSALHGIRSVSAWPGVRVSVPDSDVRDRWQAELGSYSRAEYRGSRGSGVPEAGFIPNAVATGI